MAIRELSAAQRVLLQNVKDADAALVDLSRSIDEEQRIEKQRRMTEQRNKLDVAIRRAVEGDDGNGPDRDKAIPKRRVTIEGLGVKNPYKVLEALERTSGEASVNEAASVSTAGLEWLEKGEKIAVRLRHFPTTNPDENYPEVLSGVIVKAEGSVNGWGAELDASDRETKFGLVPGFLRWELDRPRDGKGLHLIDMIEEWARG